MNTAVKIDTTKYIGSWTNSYDVTKGIESFKISNDTGELKIHVVGKEGGLLPGNWGETTLYPHAYSPDKTKALAFQAQFDLGYVDLNLAINENKGLLVIFAFITFKDDSGRSNCFIREFFFKK